VIEHQALVVIHVVRVGRPAEQVARKFHHVVGAAIFGGGGAEFAGEFSGIGVPRLVIAGAARAVGALAGDFIPEVFGDVAVIRLARELVVTRGGNHLRDVRVDVQAFEFVAMRGQRIEEPFLIEALGHVQVIFFSGHGVEVREHFSHAAVLGSEDSLHVVIAERAGVVTNPVRHALGDFERLLICGVDEHIEVAGHDFVDGVERRPHALTITQAIEELDRKRAEVSAVVQAFLTFRQFSDDRVSILFQILIAGARVHERDRGKIVASGEMAAEFAVGSFPSAKRLRRGGKSGIYAKGVQQAIRRE